MTARNLVPVSHDTLGVFYLKNKETFFKFDFFPAQIGTILVIKCGGNKKTLTEKKTAKR